MKHIRRSKSLFFPVLLFVFLGIFLFPPWTQAVKQGGVLKIAIGMNPNRMDPPNSYAGSDMMIGSHIFERLVFFHYDEKTKKTTPRPALAERWERSADGKVWTFHLRKGVTFHDGTPFNADAVKFNIDRTIDPEKKTRYGGDLREVVERVEVVDENTVKVYCKKAVGPFLDLIGQPCLGMMSPASVEKYGQKIGRHPTGTGPFKFVKWIPGERVELEVNKDYWKGRANLDGLDFRFVPDNNARINMLQAGEIDIAYNVPVPDHERLRKTGKFDIISWPTATILRLWMNCQKPPTNDVRVRQAIKLAIDRPGIVRDILLGNARISKSTVAPFSWGYYPAAKVVHDPEKARKLLAEAGWVDKDGDGIREKGGNKLSLEIRAPQAGRYPMDRESLLAIQENLRNVGFACKLNFMEFAAFLNSMFVPVEKSKEGASFVSWSSRTHAWFATYKLFHSSFWIPRGMNATYYKNPKVDQLLDRAVIELDPSKSYELYKAIQIVLEKETPMIPLWLMNYMIAKKKTVHNVTCIPIPVSDTFNAKEAWME